jgi:oxygen-independent coproporphyrinogen-3 oxidase
VAVYVHVPFCVRRCAYCDFASEVRGGERVRTYLEAIAREVDLCTHRGAALGTVYFGGGTPTALNEAELRALFELIGTGFDVSRVREWTVEANPGTVDEARLCAIRASGASRLSLGVQSFDDRVLQVLGRIHRASQASEAIASARRAGFDNISIDLMYAVPGQSLVDLRRDVARAVELSPDHVSIYGLTYERGTPMSRRRDEGLLSQVDEELERRMYLAAIDDLERAGYAQYEIASFARDGKVSHHNTTYWTGGEYVGLGPSAASYLGGTRSTNCRDLDEYARGLALGEYPAAERERLESERAAREALVLELRTRLGVEPGAFFRRTGFDLHELLGEAGRAMAVDGWLEWHGGRVRLSRKALPVADEILAQLVSA